MSEEVQVHVGVVRVTDASILGRSTYNRIKADNLSQHLSVHFQTDGGNAPGPREALLVAILSGIRPHWLQDGDGAHDKVIIDFQAVSAVPRDGNFDVFRMSTVEHGSALNRLRLTMGNESGSLVHTDTELSKGQVTQMIAALLALYPQLREE